MSRFANKNTIALGLGCVGSGGLVLGFELVLRMGTNPSTEDEALLYGTCAGMKTSFHPPSSCPQSELSMRMGTNPSTEDEALLYGACAGAQRISSKNCSAAPGGIVCVTPPKAGACRGFSARCSAAERMLTVPTYICALDNRLAPPSRVCTCSCRFGAAGHGVGGVAADPALALHRGGRRARGGGPRAEGVTRPFTRAAAAPGAHVRLHLLHEHGLKERFLRLWRGFQVRAGIHQLAAASQGRLCAVACGCLLASPARSCFDAHCNVFQCSLGFC